MNTLRLIGPGRAGRSLAAALADVGCDVRGFVSAGDDPTAAAVGVDLLVIATPDSEVARVATAVRPVPTTVVMHLSGALGLDVLAPHARRAAVHPLVPLPSPEVGRVRLRSGVTFAVAGDPVADEVVRLLGGRRIVVDDGQRAAYHAAACMASNHVVALLGQVERVAATAGVGLDAFVELTRTALADVADMGPAAALTGPASRGDEATIARHRAALAPEELPGYDAGVALARRLAADGAGADHEGRPLAHATAAAHAAAHATAHAGNGR
ncbi:MAG: DUF2520 domain-containing protein [Acidimicrobiales bacterium]